MGSRDAASLSRGSHDGSTPLSDVVATHADDAGGRCSHPPASTQPARHRSAYPGLAGSSPQTGQVPGFGSSVLGSAPTGTRGKVTYRVYGTVPVLMTWSSSPGRSTNA